MSDVVFSFGVDEAEEHVRDEHSTYSWLSDDRFLAEYLVIATS